MKGKGSVDNKIVSKDIITITNNDQVTKEYLDKSKKILDDLKKTQNVIKEAQGADITILIKVAQNNLTKTALEECTMLVRELQRVFNEENVNDFIEHSITLITSIETANYLYGNIIDIDDVRKRISAKATKQILIRGKKLIEQLKITSFENKVKLSIIVDQLNLCMKVYDYCWDIYPKNIKALRESNNIIAIMIIHRIKLGLDNYNVEALKMVIDKNESKISSILSNTSNDSGVMTKENIENHKKDSENILVTNENCFFTNFDIEANTEATALVQTKNSVTDKFIDMTNKVIKEVTESSSNDFMNIALQKFYSIISAIETINYIEGNVVNKHAVALNISSLLTEMIYSNYKAIKHSWDEMLDKNPEDYVAYAKEIKKYCHILIEAYDMCNDNINSLKTCVIIEKDLYNMRTDFNFNKIEIENLKKTIESQLEQIWKIDKKFNIEKNEHDKESKKRRGLWAKIFN